MIHVLKTWSECFSKILDNSKKFDIRENDRNFKIGDRLDFMEYDLLLNEYTGRHCHRWITYIMDNRNPFLDIGNKVILSLTNEEPENDHLINNNL